jgi:alkane 1-monooxygenase
MIRFAAPFAFLLSVPLLYAINPIAVLATPLSLIFALLLTERIGRRREAPRIKPVQRVLPIFYIPLQLAVTGWATWLAGRSAFTFADLACLATSVGVCTGVFGLLAAHELIHSRSQRHRRFGLLLLFSMSYPHFRIAHVYGHHRHAATERDASTARLGESFYSFLARTIPAQLSQAWRFERKRTGTALLHNRVVQGGVVLAAGYVLIGLWASNAVAFLLVQSAVAIVVLELFNYIAHYGLVRQVRGATFEALAPYHSWNSSGVGNLLIFNMGHHSNHHSAPESAFDRLRPAAGARELPAGYAGAILLALVPPLWRAVMDRRISCAATTEFTYTADSSPAALFP